MNIRYVCLCHTGRLRKENQDNFWCNGKFLNIKNNGLVEPMTGLVSAGLTPAFAVFDGVGGERHGETAAYIAVQTFNRRFSKKVSEKDVPDLLKSTCIEMNRSICEYAEKNRIMSMGTTAAILVFTNTAVFICNLGDSRIYKSSESSLIQVSQDHVSPFLSGGKKPPLDQYLGIPEYEFLIDPYIAEDRYVAGNRYLLCTDGLTDMLTDIELRAILPMGNKLDACADILLNTALGKGEIDNITLILCEVSA